MALVDKIRYIYPQLTDADFAPLGNISIRNDGAGDYIASWANTECSRPTEAQLEATPDVPYTPVPTQVPMWAVRTVLQNDGLFDQAQSLVNASTDNALKNVWEYGNFADRNSNAIISLATALGLTSKQVDQMFIDANNFSV